MRIIYWELTTNCLQDSNGNGLFQVLSRNSVLIQENIKRTNRFSSMLLTWNDVWSEFGTFYLKAICLFVIDVDRWVQRSIIIICLVVLRLFLRNWVILAKEAIGWPTVRIKLISLTNKFEWLDFLPSFFNERRMA